MRVLLEAYACRAESGSEPGQGWGWAHSLAAVGHDVVVLTRPKHREENDRWLATHELPNLTVEYVASPFGGRLERTLGRQWDYVAWSRASARRARELHRDHRFDVAHHVTFGTILLGSGLYHLDVPFVYGPLGGGQRSPKAAARWLEGTWRSEMIRNAAVSLSSYSPISRPAARRAAIVLTTNFDTSELATAMGARRLELMADTGINDELIMSPRRHMTGKRLIWVGGDRSRKGLRLAIECLAQARQQEDVTLTVIGPAIDRVVGMAEKYGVERAVDARGRLPWSEVQESYLQHDAFLFTSLRESLGGQLVEAAAAGLPIVGLNLHGLRDIVPNAAAVKAPLDDNSAASLADGCIAVLSCNERYLSMSREAVAFARSVSWTHRASQASGFYEELVSRVPG